MQKQKIHLVQQQKLQNLLKPEETAVKTGLYPSLELELDELEMDVGGRPGQQQQQQQQPMGEDDSDMPDIMRESFPDDAPPPTGGLMGDGTFGQTACCLK